MTLIPENAKTKHIAALGATGSGKTSAIKAGLVEPCLTARDREQISEATDYKRSSRDSYLQRLTARELIHHATGSPTASPDLFD